MSFETHVETDKTFDYSGALDFPEFLDHIKDWFDRHGYDINEKEYTEKKREPRVHQIKWECDKKVDDYHKFVIKPKIKIEFKEVEKDNKKLFEGDLTVTIKADVIRDHEENWKGSTTKRFARAIYDKFIMEEKESVVNSKLKKEVISLFNELKKYFQ